MAREDSNGVRVLMAIDNPIVRKGIFDAFRVAGYGQIEMTSTQEELHRALDEQRFDLIVVAAHLGAWSTGPLLADIRNGRGIHHRFPVVVMLLEDGAADSVRAALSSGADSLLVLPVAPSLVLARINELANRRKPFVVTRDYTGPDRRKEERRDGVSAPMVEAPNPLRARLDRVPAAQFEAEIARVARRLNTLKVERYEAQIGWVVAAIGKMLHAGESHPETLAGYGSALAHMADSLPAVLGSAMTARLRELLDAVTRAARTILREAVVLTVVEYDLIAAACAALLQELASAVSDRHPP